MKTEGSIEIQRRIEEVFDLTNNHVPEWSTIVVAEESLTTTPEVVGSTFRTITGEHGKQMEFLGVVTHYDPPYASAVKLTGELFDIEAAYRFEDLSGQTRVTQMSIVHGKGPMKLLFFFLGWMMKKSSCQSLQKELNGLKDFCENYDHQS